MSKEKSTKKEERKNNLALKAVAATGILATAGLAVVCYKQKTDIDKLMLSRDIYREAYDGVTMKIAELQDNTEIVRQVVGGPLIDRLIKNEDKTLSRYRNKKESLINEGINNITQKVLEEYEDKIQNCKDTIADFRKVKDLLK